jgi:hypothetical protein
MINKRKSVRHHVEGKGIYAKTIFDSEIEILDISTGGCSIRGTKRFVMGSEYLFKFAFGNGVVGLKGVIIWEKLSGLRKVSESESVPIYTSGVKFSDVQTEKAGLITKLIASKIADLKEHRLSSVRFKIHQPEKAVLSSAENCMVKDISLGGMRIEAGEEVSEGIIFSLELMLAPNQGDHSISCKGRVAFCLQALDKMPESYIVGVEFLDMSETDKIEIKKFIEGLTR